MNNEYSEQHTLRFIETLNDIYDLQKRIKVCDASQTDVDLYDGKEMVKWNYERLDSYKNNLVHYVCHGLSRNV